MAMSGIWGKYKKSYQVENEIDIQSVPYNAACNHNLSTHSAVSLQFSIQFYLIFHLNRSLLFFPSRTF